MLGAITLILFCQLTGEIIARITKLPVPGPVIGMVILFCGLCITRKIPAEIEAAGGFFLRYLALLFVPAGVGVIVYVDLLKKFWLPITGAVLIGTMLTIAVTGVVMQSLNHLRSGPKGEQP